MNPQHRVPAPVTGTTWVEGLHARSRVSTWVRVPADQAFAYIADMSRHVEWASDPITVTPVTDGPVHLGSRYRSVGHQAGRDWPAELEVTAYEPPHRFAFTATGGPLPSPTGDPHRHEFLLTAENSGTRLELSRWNPKPPGWPTWVWTVIGAPLVRMTLKHRLRTVEQLRDRLDTLALPRSDSV